VLVLGHEEILGIQRLSPGTGLISGQHGSIGQSAGARFFLRQKLAEVREISNQYVL
jgi:hypothetical protein